MAEMYLAWDPAILNRADDHGCLDENVETGDPIVCGLCLTAPNLPSPDTEGGAGELPGMWHESDLSGGWADSEEENR